MAARRTSGPLLASLLRRLQSLNVASVATASVAMQSRLFTTTTTASPRAAAERAPAAASSAAAASAAARARTSGGHEALVRLPSDLVGAAEAFIGATGTSAKHAKQRAWLLGEALKRLSRSGGGNRISGGGGASSAAAATAAAAAAAASAAAEQEASSLVRRTRSGRPRARDLAALGDVVAERGAAALSEQDLALYVFGERGGGRGRGAGGGDDRGRNRRRLPMAATGQEQQQHQQLQEPGADATPMYDRADAAAYALVRLAPCYAACRAAMAEVAARLGGGGGGGGGKGGAAGAPAAAATATAAFKPRRMLDFGAGPGTAVWAAQDVWLAPWAGRSPGDAASAPLRTAHAVEPSAAMTALGRRLEAARLASLSRLDALRARAAGLPTNLPRRPLAPGVSWAPSLAALRRRAAGGAGRRRYDLVACSYVVSEIAEASDRDRVVRALWDMVSEGGVLLLVDAGTPLGSAAVQRARSLVLDVALRRAAKQDRRGGAGGADGASAGAASSSALEAAREEGGAYVVAPCPHDGPCPMQAAAALRDEVEAAAEAAAAEKGSGEKETEDEDEDDEGAAAGASGGAGANGGWADSWCHFGQRLQRPAFMRSAKARPGARSARHDHQDERFSYVAIRRGRRPEPLAPGHAVGLAAAGGGGGGGGVFGAGAAAAAGGNSSAAALLPLFAAVGEADFEQDDDDDDGDDQNDRSLLDDQLLEAIDDMVPPSAADAGFPPLSPRDAGEQGGDEDDDAGDDDDQEDDNDDAAVPVSLGAGPGLVDRLVALDAAGVEWWRPEALAGLQGEGGEAAAPPLSSPSSPSAGASVAAAMAAAATAPVSLADAGPGAGECVDARPPSGEDAFRRRRDAQASLVAAAGEGALGWARLVRPPLKRGGHVVLDLCCASSAPAASSSSSTRGPPIKRASPAPEGRLVRATVTRASLARAWGGGAGGGGGGGGGQQGAAAAGAAAYSLARSLRWGDAMPLPPAPPLQQQEGKARQGESDSD